MKHLAQAICSICSDADGSLLEIYGFLLQYVGNLEEKLGVRSSERNAL